MRRSPILAVVVRAEFHTLLLISVYLLFAGHNEPGGGFAGGLMAGAAFTLRFVAGGIDELRDAIRLRPTTVLGAGLLLAAATAVTPLFTGRELLEQDEWRAELPLLGTAKTTSALLFDAGVYVVVVGLVLVLLDTFGRARSRPERAGSRPPAGAEDR
jgi:multisubunit Na+/H+ antiporter MnhB subunit